MVYTICSGSSLIGTRCSAFRSSRPLALGQQKYAGFKPFRTVFLRDSSVSKVVKFGNCRAILLLRFECKELKNYRDAEISLQQSEVQRLALGSRSRPQKEKKQARQEETPQRTVGPQGSNEGREAASAESLSALPENLLDRVQQSTVTSRQARATKTSRQSRLGTSKRQTSQETQECLCQAGIPLVEHTGGDLCDLRQSPTREASYCSTLFWWDQSRNQSSPHLHGLPQRYPSMDEVNRACFMGARHGVQRDAATMRSAIDPCEISSTFATGSGGAS